MIHPRALNVLAVLLAAGSLAQAQTGPYRPLAIGMQIDYSRAVNPDTVALTSGDGTPQGKPLENLYGLGVTAQWRIGEVLWKMRDLVLQTTVGVRYNRESDKADMPSYKAVIGTTPTTLTDVSWSRKNRMQEFYIQAPLRWYPVTGGDLEGFFLEGGPGWVRMDMKADIDLKGTYGGGPVAITDAATYRQNKAMWVFNVGYTTITRDSVMSYTLGVEKVVNAGNLGGTTGKFAIQFQF